MDELNSHPNDRLRSITSDEEQSFVLQSSSSDDHHDENLQYHLNIPLCISKIYEKEFFDHVCLYRK